MPINYVFHGYKIIISLRAFYASGHNSHRHPVCISEFHFLLSPIILLLNWDSFKQLNVFLIFFWAKQPQCSRCRPYLRYTQSYWILLLAWFPRDTTLCCSHCNLSLFFPALGFTSSSHDYSCRPPLLPLLIVYILGERGTHGLLSH